MRDKRGRLVLFVARAYHALRVTCSAYPWLSLDYITIFLRLCRDFVVACLSSVCSRLRRALARALSLPPPARFPHVERFCAVHLASRSLPLPPASLTSLCPPRRLLLPRCLSLCVRPVSVFTLPVLCSLFFSLSSCLCGYSLFVHALFTLALALASSSQTSSRLSQSFAQRSCDSCSRTPYSSRGL